ncbi:MAG: sulfite exporter TauE/SafE family protein [Candidatus Bathyarchaeota archaeon]|nr:sulfite exporter TauE/SafE family protein [Candidatus Bathyarchaeota archaeon]
MSTTDLTNPYLWAFSEGLVYGLAVCTASCLPLLAGYIAGVGSGFKKSVKITMIFNSGRVVAYTAIGIIIALFSGLIRLLISDTAFSPFQIYSSVAFGIVTVLIGASVLYRIRKPACECIGKNEPSFFGTGKVGRHGVDFGAFSLGLTRGLVICPPLILILATSLPLVSPAGSVAISVLFGLGTTISPMLLLGGVTGWLLSKAPLFRKGISIAGGGILILLGAYTMYNSLIQLT